MVAPFPRIWGIFYSDPRAMDQFPLAGLAGLRDHPGTLHALAAVLAGGSGSMRTLLVAGFAFALSACPSPSHTDAGEAGDVVSDITDANLADVPLDLQPASTAMC